MHQTAPFNKISKRSTPQNRHSKCVASTWNYITFPKRFEPPPKYNRRNATVRMNILY